MNPYITEQLVRDHLDALRREAEGEALARKAREARSPRGIGTALMPHVQDRGRFGRAVASLLRPTNA